MQASSPIDESVSRLPAAPRGARTATTVAAAVCIAWVSLAAPSALADAPEAVATFESLSLYWTPDDARERRYVGVRYRTLTPVGAWRAGYPMPYAAIPGTDAEGAVYRGSLVQLQPGTEYEVELTHHAADGSVLERDSLVARTWADAFPEHSDVTRLDDRTTPLVLERSGSADAYRVYDGLQPDGSRARIDVGTGNGSPRQAVRIDASYVILRNVEVVGGQHGIRIFGGTDIVIEDADIHSWGHVDDRYGQTFGRNHDAAVKSTEDSLARLVVQRTRMHHPFTDSNSWAECRLDLSGGEPCTESREYHPGGPQAIDLINSRGNHVFRYNAAYSDSEHYFNDIFGGAYGWSDYGYVGHDTDIYGNYLANCWDDAIELEGGIRNVRVWGNLIDQTYQALANDAVLIGPLYFFRNTMRRSDRFADRAQAGHAAKGGGPRDIADVPAYTYYFHNTLDNQRGDGFNGLGNGSRGLYHFVSRNNVLHTRGGPSVSTSAQSRAVDADYDLYSAAVPRGSEAHGISGTPRFEAGEFDFATLGFDYRLRADSAGVDAGEVLPNFSDGYHGTGPDIGAHERGRPAMHVGPDAYARCEPVDERCGDGLDDDCDGEVDEGCPGPRPRVSRVPHLSVAPRVDGDLSDLPVTTTTLNEADSSAVVHAAWTEEALFLGFHVADPDVRAHAGESESGPIWLDDAVQVFLDPENDGGGDLGGTDLQVVINARGARFTSREVELESVAVVDGSANDTEADEGYLVEMAIPWGSLAREPVGGLEVGANLALSSRSRPDDGSPRGGRSSSRDWSGGTRDFRVPSRWGTFVLSGGDGSRPMVDGGTTGPGAADAGDAGLGESDDADTGGCSVGRPRSPGAFAWLLLFVLVCRRRARREPASKDFRME
tara:strand:+ start:1317 stop:3974 length:2658 start_codon:yes stop_codon:yes gene_type:complete